MKQLMKSDTTEVLKAAAREEDIAVLLKGINDRGLDILESWAKCAVAGRVKVTNFGRISKQAGSRMLAAVVAEMDRRFNA